MARKNKVRINSKVDDLEYEPIVKTYLSEERQKFCQGDAITSKYFYKTRIIYICPHCGHNHDLNYRRLTGQYQCLKCKKSYRYPREGKEKYKPISVFNSKDKTPIENPDWVK